MRDEGRASYPGRPAGLAPATVPPTAPRTKHHPWFQSFLEARGYYDVFLINEHGKVDYTVFKELDYATDLNTGQWKDSDLAKVWQRVQNNQRTGYIAFTDFAPYAPSHGAPASFIAVPVWEHNGVFHGALIFQMPFDRINAVMQQAQGMVESGETYIVGEDFLMQSDSRFSKESTALTPPCVGSPPTMEGTTAPPVVLARERARGFDLGPRSKNGRGAPAAHSGAPCDHMSQRLARLPSDCGPIPEF